MLQEKVLEQENSTRKTYRNIVISPIFYTSSVTMSIKIHEKRRMWQLNHKIIACTVAELNATLCLVTRGKKLK